MYNLGASALKVSLVEIGKLDNNNNKNTNNKNKNKEI